MSRRRPRAPGRAGLWAALVGVLFVIAAVVGTVSDRDLADTLKSRGERVDSQVVGVSHGRGGVDGATVRFLVGTRTVTTDLGTSDGLPGGLSVGQTRTVVYDPVHPSHALLPEQLGAASDLTLGIVFIVIASLVTVGGLIWWWFEHEQAE